MYIQYVCLSMYMSVCVCVSVCLCMSVTDVAGSVGLSRSRAAAPMVLSCCCRTTPSSLPSLLCWCRGSAHCCHVVRAGLELHLALGALCVQGYRLLERLWTRFAGSTYWVCWSCWWVQLMEVRVVGGRHRGCEQQQVAGVCEKAAAPVVIYTYRRAIV